MYGGEKVILRELRKSEMEIVKQGINDKEVRYFLSDQILPYKYEDEISWYDGVSGNTLKGYNFAIEDKETGKYIGACGVNELKDIARVATIGILIFDKKYWNRGYGTDALNVLIDFLFNQVNMNKISLKVYSFNERAKASYRKCGFVEEGVMRQEIYKNGRYYDEIYMGLLKEEYNSRKEKE